MDVLCSGYGLVESPRRHEGRLWFSDWTGGRIVAVDDAGRSEVVVEPGVVGQVVRVPVDVPGAGWPAR